MSGQGAFASLGRILALIAAGSMLAACGVAGPPGVKTKFSEAAYGVKASPRVVAYNKPVPKGGGRYTVGKPYKVRGEWFHPSEDPDYVEVGVASWYGPNFHGRRTANGEVYDMYALSAAHPTLPMPSYARVTNLNNGRSVVVRINDRGPFSRGRVIDLSAQAATLLDYTKTGLARVEVKYLGRARMDGLDHDMLMASYSGPGAGQVGGGRISDAQIRVAAMPTPPPRPLPSGIATGTYTIAANTTRNAPSGMTLRPSLAGDPIAALIEPVSSYAEPARLSRAHLATAALAHAAEIPVGEFATTPPDATLQGRTTIQVGAFGDPQNANRLAKALSAHGVPTVTEFDRDGRMLYAVRLAVDNRQSSPEQVIAAAAELGAKGAYLLSR